MNCAHWRHQKSRGVCECMWVCWGMRGLRSESDMNFEHLQVFMMVRKTSFTIQTAHQEEESRADAESDAEPADALESPWWPVLILSSGNKVLKHHLWAEGGWKNLCRRDDWTIALLQDKSDSTFRIIFNILMKHVSVNVKIQKFPIYNSNFSLIRSHPDLFGYIFSNVIFLAHLFRNIVHFSFKDQGLQSILQILKVSK